MAYVTGRRYLSLDGFGNWMAFVTECVVTDYLWKGLRRSRCVLLFN